MSVDDGPFDDPDWYDDDDGGPCPRCWGDGQVDIRVDDVVTETIICPECNGTGLP